MTSLINDKSRAGYLIRLTASESPTGKRAKITCSGLTKKQSQQVQLHVDNILSARASGLTLERATAEWVGQLQGPIRERLETLGLIEASKRTGSLTLVGYMTEHIRKRSDIAASTKRIFCRSLHFAQQFFGDAKRLSEVTNGNVKDFGRWLREPGRKNETEGLAENTARKMTDKLKTVFNAAVDDEILARNPFSGVPTTIQSNEEKQVFVDADTVRTVIANAPDPELAGIIALARFGGLRTPSEFRHLKHGDFSLDGEIPTFTIFCQKTAHTGKKTRTAPVFAELRPYVAALVDSNPANCDEFVFSERYRECTDANIYNAMCRVLRSAEVQRWPDLWRNLRASRESELLQQGYNIKDVCQWLGNTPKVVMDHYLRSDPDALRRATRTSRPEEHESPEGAAQSGVVTDGDRGDLSGDLHRAALSERSGTEPNAVPSQTQQKPCVLRKRNKKPSRLTGRLMLWRGLEPPRGYPHMPLKHACLPIPPPERIPH